MYYSDITNEELQKFHRKTKLTASYSELNELNSKLFNKDTPNKCFPMFYTDKITGNEIFEELFNDEEIEIYRDFAEQLSRLISNIDKDTKYYYDIEVIQKKLSDLYKNVMLEKYIPENNKLIRCFINGMYRYWSNAEFDTDYLKKFIKLLKSCNNEKKNIVLNNLHSRFDGIERVDNELVGDDEIPF